MSATTTTLLAYSSTTWAVGLYGLACGFTLFVMCAIGFASALGERRWDALVARQDSSVDLDRAQFDDIVRESFGPCTPHQRNHGFQHGNHRNHNTETST